MIAFIIWLVGYILAFVVGINSIIKTNKKLELIDLIWVIVGSFLSWIALLMALIIFHGDIVIYERKPKEKS